MKILLTGATGYIGKRLLPILLEKGHEVYCCVRDSKRFYYSGKHLNKVHVIEIDFLDEPGTNIIPDDIEIAYYLIHSMSTSTGDFEDMETQSARNFVSYLSNTKASQIIYLSGISNESKLSKHLASRKRVEDILSGGKIPVTVLRAGIIVGSGSASFEIIRDLVEKLPIMIAPKWLMTKSQPVAVRDIIAFLTGVIGKTECYGEVFDIGGPDTLTYKEMLLQFAAVRWLKRKIFIVPVMTPRLSSYWLYFVTSVSYNLAVNLVNSMKIEVVARDNRLSKILSIKPISYKEAVSEAFQMIAQNHVISSWKDSFVSSAALVNQSNIEIPEHGCIRDTQEILIEQEPSIVLQNIWSIGGDNGWYYANFLWKVRGYLDKMAGGVGLRRGRTHPTELNTGDALDFWRVLIADKKEKRLALFAEMRLPGEAWLEFRITRKEKQYYLRQVATFRPKGLWGRLYWHLVSLFHILIFRGMAKSIAQKSLTT